MYTIPAIYLSLKTKDVYVFVPVAYGQGRTVRPFLRAAMSKGARLSNTTCTNGTFWWLIKKGQLERVQAALVEKYGSCLVSREYSNSQKCTASCQNAEGDECVCICLGQFHGHGESPEHSWTNVVGDLLVSSDKTTVTRLFTRDN